MLEWLEPVFRDRAAAKAAKARSLQIDNELKQHASAWNPKNQCAILMAQREQRKVMRNLKLVTTGFSDAERMAWRKQIRDQIKTDIRILIDCLKLLTPCDSSLVELELQLLEDFCICDLSSSWRVKIVRALPRLAEHPEIHFIDHASASYFLSNLDRCLEPKYIPSDEDIMMMPSTSRLFDGVPHFLEHSMKHTTQPVRINFVDMTSISGHRKKWLHYFEDAPFIIVSLDLAMSDINKKYESEAFPLTIASAACMVQSFDSSRWFRRSGIILLLTNYGCLQTESKSLEYAEVIPDYQVGGDPKVVLNFILSKIQDVNHAAATIHPFVCDGEGFKDDTIIKDIENAVLMTYARTISCFCSGSDESETKERPSILPDDFHMY